MAVATATALAFSWPRSPLSGVYGVGFGLMGGTYCSVYADIACVCTEQKNQFLKDADVEPFNNE